MRNQVTALVGVNVKDKFSVKESMCSRGCEFNSPFFFSIDSIIHCNSNKINYYVNLCSE